MVISSGYWNILFLFSKKVNCQFIPKLIAVPSSSQHSAALVGKHWSPYFSFMGNNTKLNVN